MANQTPDGVILERPNPDRDIRAGDSPLNPIYNGRAASPPALGADFAVGAAGTAVSLAAVSGALHAHDISERMNELRGRLQAEKANPFTFSNGDQAAMLKLANLMAQGGPFSGVLASADRAAILKREEDERRNAVNAAVAAMSAQELAHRVAAAMVEFNKDLDDALEKMARGEITAKEAADQASASLENQINQAETPEEQEAILSAAEETVGQNRDATPEFKDEFQSNVDDLRARLASTSEVHATFEEHRGRGHASAIRAVPMSAILVGSPSPVTDNPPASPDEYLAKMKADNRAFIDQQHLAFGEIQVEINRMREQIGTTREALEAEGGSALSGLIKEEMDRELQELADMQSELDGQRAIIALQEKVNTLTEKYVEEDIIPRIKAGEQVDRAFIISAIVNVPEDLVKASEELAVATGRRGNDPISQLAAMAENPESGMSDQERSDIRQLVSDISEIRAERAELVALKDEKTALLTEMEEYKANLEERISNVEAQSDGFITVARGPAAGGMISAALTDQSLGQHAYYADQGLMDMERRMAEIDQKIADNEAREAELLGKTVDVAEDDASQDVTTDEVPVNEAPADGSLLVSETDAPAPAPTEGFISGMSPETAIFAATDDDGIISRADAERILRENYGFSSSQIDDMLPQIASKLENDGYIIEGMDNTEPVQVAGLVVGGRIPAPEVPQPAPQPEAPEMDDLRLATAVRSGPSAYSAFSPA